MAGIRRELLVLVCSLVIARGASAQLYLQSHIDLGVPPADHVAFYSSQLQSHPTPIDDERARVFDDFHVATNSRVTGLEWTGAFDLRFNLNEDFRGEMDFVVQVFGHNATDNKPDLANLVKSWVLDAGSSGRNDGSDVRTAQRMGEVSAEGGLIFDYAADPLPSPVNLVDGTYWLAITAVQTFPSPSPVLEPGNPDRWWDPIWGWHVGDGPDHRAFQFDAIRDSFEPGTPIAKDLSFSVIGNPLLPGDFDYNGFLDDVDIDLLSQHIRDDGQDALYDLNSDGLVNQADRETWVVQLFETYFGDANLDHAVMFDDFLSLSAAFSEVGGWANGDFTGDAMVQFDDFLLLSTNFGMVASVRKLR